MSRHPSIQHLVNLLKVNENLPEDLKKISSRFEKLRDDLLEDVKEDTPEVAAGLRKILEAKDCFVRAGGLVLGQISELVDDVTTDPETDGEVNSPVESNLPVESNSSDVSVDQAGVSPTE